jgi:hypothetical protein
MAWPNTIHVYPSILIQPDRRQSMSASIKIHPQRKRLEEQTWHMQDSCPALMLCLIAINLILHNHSFLLTGFPIQHVAWVAVTRILYAAIDFTSYRRCNCLVAFPTEGETLSMKITGVLEFMRGDTSSCRIYLPVVYVLLCHRFWQNPVKILNRALVMLEAIWQTPQQNMQCTVVCETTLITR